VIRGVHSARSIIENKNVGKVYIAFSDKPFKRGLKEGIKAV
jgi:hypothetical protein